MQDLSMVLQKGIVLYIIQIQLYEFPKEIGFSEQQFFTLNEIGKIYKYNAKL